MLQFLLDEHISPRVARQLVARQPRIHAASMSTWRDGKYLAASDEQILLAAYKEHLSLVTYDLRTIAPLLKSWAESDQNHAGVIFVDGQALAAHDVGGLVLALERLWDEQNQLKWENRVIFLRRK